MKIRSLTAEDLRNILPLWKELAEAQAAVENVLAVQPDGGEQYIQYIESRLSESSFHATCADEEGRMLGFCISSLQKRPPSFIHPTVGYIDDLVVDPKLKRQGVGTALIDEAREWLRSKGQTRIEMQVLMGNSAAVKFWEQSGFSPYMVRCAYVFDEESV